MKDILVLITIALGAWIFVRMMLKEPILPWKEKARKDKGTTTDKTKKKTKKHAELDEDDTQTFKDLFANTQSIESHMIRQHDNVFKIMAEVQPINYFLRDYEEQEIIDGAFETWLAATDYHERIYLQNRFVDLIVPIEEIQKNMRQADDLNLDSIDYGENVVKELMEWQSAQPRYETKRYLIFSYKVEVKDLRIDEDDDVEERILEKAFSELHRRVLAARQHLRRGEMEVELLSTDGIIEVLYYTFNRRKALKNRYRDIERQEMLSMYVTADQTVERILHVRGEIENHVQEEREREFEEIQQ